MPAGGSAFVPGVGRHLLAKLRSVFTVDWQKKAQPRAYTPDAFKANAGVVLPYVYVSEKPWTDKQYSSHRQEYRSRLTRVRAVG